MFKCKLLANSLLLSLINILSLSTTGCKTSKEVIPTKNLRLNFTSPLATLDPRKSSDAYSSALIFMLYQGLTRYNSVNGEIEPALAEKILISEDKKTYTFHLKEAYWTNGAPITAKDFELSWKEILDPSFPAPNAPLFYCIKNAKLAKIGQSPLEEVGIYAKDDSTFVVELEQPTPYFLSLISFCSFLPVCHENSPLAANAIDKDWDHITSSGPFKVNHYKHQVELILDKNPTYLRSFEVKLDKISISFVPDEVTAFELFNREELDLIGFQYSSIPSDAISYLNSHNQLKTAEVPSTIFCTYNLKKPFFNNFYIRKAFDLAINRNAICENVIDRRAIEATSLIPPMQRTKEPEINPPIFSAQNTLLAKDYLDKGLAALSSLSPFEIPKVTLLCIAEKQDIKVAEVIQEQIRSSLNIHLQIEVLDPKYYFSKLYKRDYDLAICTASSQYDEPSSLLSRFENAENAKNYSSWFNPEFATLLEKAYASQDDASRLSLYLKADELMQSQLPISLLYHTKHLYLINPKLKGVFVSPIGSTHFDKADFVSEEN